MKYWKIVGESVALDGDVSDMMTYDYRNNTWRQDGRDDGECTTFWLRGHAEEYLSLAQQDEGPGFRIRIVEVEADDALPRHARSDHPGRVRVERSEMTYYYFANGFHNSEARIRVHRDGQVISPAVMRRVDRELCGIDTCRCSGSSASRPNDGQRVGADGWIVLPLRNLSCVLCDALGLSRALDPESMIALRVCEEPFEGSCGEQYTDIIHCATGERVA